MKGKIHYQHILKSNFWGWYSETIDQKVTTITQPNFTNIKFVENRVILDNYNLKLKRGSY